MLHRLTTALISLSVVYEIQIQILHHFQYVSGLLAALLVFLDLMLLLLVPNLGESQAGGTLFRSK